MITHFSSYYSAHTEIKCRKHDYTCKETLLNVTDNQSDTIGKKGKEKCCRSRRLSSVKTQKGEGSSFQGRKPLHHLAMVN